MSTRRAFLRILGIAPVSAPLAAKAAADEAVARLAGVVTAPGTGGAPGFQVLPDGKPDWKAKIRRYLAEQVVPEWFEEELRERNRHVGYLDPDLACKRSWSMSVKIATQRQRNIDRARLAALDEPRRRLRSAEFEEEHGVWL